MPLLKSQWVGVGAQAALLARGRTVRQAKLQFFAKMAEKGLSCYERDGWGEYPTNIVPERREVRSLTCTTASRFRAH